MIMGYEMYRLLNYASDPKVKKASKKPKKNQKSTGDSDEDSSSSDDKIWLKKATKTKADLATIEKYRKLNTVRVYRENTRHAPSPNFPGSVIPGTEMQGAVIDLLWSIAGVHPI